MSDILSGVYFFISPLLRLLYSVPLSSDLAIEQESGISKPIRKPQSFFFVIL